VPRWGALQKFLGRTVGDAASYAAGQATSATLEPYLREVTNQAWIEHLSLPLDPDVAADIAAEDPAEVAAMRNEANKSGLNDPPFDLMTETKRTGPSIGELLQLLRRGKLTPAQWTKGLRKQKLNAEWDALIAELQHTKLAPEVIANAIVRGVLPAPFPVPFEPAGTGGQVPAYPQSPPALVDDAASWGIDTDRLALLTAIGGRPMSPVDAAQATFRGLIDRVDYDRAIAEGDIRPEYGQAVFDHSRQIPSVTNYIEARVRNWLTTDAEMFAGTAKHGMSEDDARLMFLIHGRPLSWHQTFIGHRRHGVYDGPTDQIDADFLKSLQESNIRPEWYNLAWAQRFNYPAAFVLRSMTQAGDITAAEAEEILLFEGWEPTLAHKVAQRWAAGGAAASKEASASELLTLYESGHATEAQTRADLTALGFPAAEVAKKIDLVAARRVVSSIGTALTDLHGAFKKQDLTRAEVLEAMAKLAIPEWARTAIADNWQTYIDAFPPPPTTPLPTGV